MSESLEPTIDLSQCRSVDRINASCALGTHCGKPGLTQHLEMLRHGGLRDPKLAANHLDDLTRRLLAACEQFENTSSDWIAEYVECVHVAPGQTGG